MHGFEKVVFLNECLSDVSEFDADIFRAVQWIFGIEFHDVVVVKLCVLVREDTVEDKFDKIKRYSLGYHVA